MERGHKQRRVLTKERETEEMAGETEITSKNDDRSGSSQLKHPSEVLQTIAAIDDNTEIVPDTDNPGNGSSSRAPLSPEYYSPPLSRRKNKKRSSSDSLSPSVGASSSIRETIEHSEDWGAAYSSGVLSRDDNVSIRISNHERDDQTESNNIQERPEKRLIDFGLRLVIIDKTLNGVRMLAFVWATVVLLGGFAAALRKIDFWFVAAISFINGTELFSRNHQLESRFIFQAVKVISGKIGHTILFFQLLAASVSIALSMTRLVGQNYAEHDGQNNMTAALIIFYAVALMHALLFLLKNAYWFWTFSHLKIIEKVRKECGFGRSGVVSLRRFFHETYWKLSKGSVYRALDLDLITFAQQLLMSNSRGDQLIAVRILNSLINNLKSSHETCHRIRTSTETMTRLIKMLSWHNQEEKAIRLLAAEIVVALADDLQLEGIQGVMDCIFSLLKQENGLNQKTINQNLLGLKILINLAGNPTNCLKITEKSVVLYKIVDFLRIDNQALYLQDRVKIAMVKKSLMLLKTIVSTNGKEGQILRSGISQIYSVVNKLRDILIHCRSRFVLITLAIEILTALSMDKAAQNKISNTEGIIGRLLSIFLDSNSMRSYRELSSKAGDALATLTVQSDKICCAILKENADVVPQLIFMLHRKVCQCAVMKILRNMCAHCESSEKRENLKLVISALPQILMIIMSSDTDMEVLEASVGLCVQISKFTTSEEFNRILIGGANSSMIDVAGRIQTIMNGNIYPNAIVPGLRRHAIELAIWIMESSDILIGYFKEAEMEKVLMKIAETTAEFENFHYFSENFGVMEHQETISSLVLKAKALLA